MKPPIIIYFVLLPLFASVVDVVDAAGASSKLEPPLVERVLGHDYPSIARPWNLCIDFPSKQRQQEILKHDISWESIGRERGGVGDRPIGANWAGKYITLGTEFANLNDCLDRRKRPLTTNPNAIFLAELRWRDYMDSSLPKEHEIWKRDSLGNRIVAKGDKMNEPRYYLDNDNKNLVQHLLNQANCIVQSGAYDGVFLDWFGPSAAFLKQLRQTLGSRCLIIINAGYNYDPERAKYINGAYLECWKTNNPATLENVRKQFKAPRSTSWI